MSTSLETPTAGWMNHHPQMESDPRELLQGRPATTTEMLSSREEARINSQKPSSPLNKSSTTLTWETWPQSWRSLDQEKERRSAKISHPLSRSGSVLTKRWKPVWGHYGYTVHYIRLAWVGASRVGNQEGCHEKRQLSLCK